MGKRMTNHLSGESSPYLLQHAENPVDWYPWGQEALEKARSEGKPIFLSIGYSACHWCHVMERESFEDERVAAFLNERFVSIKVDREERPDLDAVYMEAVQALTGRGGWPLSAWLTPDGAPFYGGTYFPPKAGRGMPSFRQVLEAIAEAWETRGSELAGTAATVREHLDRARGSGDAGMHTSARVLDRADEELHATVDRGHGGWGQAPKFPQPLVLEYLLARAVVAHKPQLEPDIEMTLDAMAAGGVYDHLGGGFHRYSTDGYWLVPHFEKMLYDNAQLARCYVHAWQALGNPRYRTVATETLDYLLREMRHPRGGFFSAQDADTVEGEGTYYTWTPQEVEGVLEAPEAAAIQATYGLTQQGDHEGRNILHLTDKPLTSADREGADGTTLARARAKLLEVRRTRPGPARDDKILAAWNGLTIAAFADAAVAFESAVYRGAAERAGEFVLSELTGEPDPGRGAGPAGGSGDDLGAGEVRGARADGGSGRLGARRLGARRLLHSWRDGRVSGEGFLDDYACVAEGFLALYRCTFDERWFREARALADAMAERFRRPAGGFYDTGVDHEVLIARPRALYDSPTPSGTAMAATVLLKMAAYTGENGYRDLAEAALDSLTGVAEAAPVMAGQWLSAALFAQSGATEVAVVGELARHPAFALVAVAREAFRPLVVLAARQPGIPSEISILLEREPPPGASAAAWVCRHSTCATPTSDPAEFERSLAE
jgi:uncharacterized protein